MFSDYACVAQDPAGPRPGPRPSGKATMENSLVERFQRRRLCERVAGIGGVHGETKPVRNTVIARHDQLHDRTAPSPNVLH